MESVCRRVLCVDDESNVLEGFRRQLRRKFDLTTATSGPEGLALIREQGPFAAVVTDYSMPEMNGVEFLQQAHAIAPTMVAIMLTGRAELRIAVTALHEGHIFRFLQKPCPIDMLERAIDEALEQYRLVVSEQLLTAELRTLNAELEERVTQRTATIRRLHRFVTDLNGLDSLDLVADLVVQTTAEMLNCGRVALMLPVTQGGGLWIQAAVGLNEETVERTHVPIGEPISGRVFRDLQSVVLNTRDELLQYGDRRDGLVFNSVPLVSAPLLTPSGPVGVLNLAEPAGQQPFDADQLALLRTLAEASAIALRNQMRLRERNEARDATILALAKLAEHRDPETGAHLERVQEYCRLLSEHLATNPKYATVISKSFIETIVRSSPLHDIGKVGISDHILLKPGRLTPHEFETMKRHSILGGDTIRNLIQQGRTQDFLQMGMEIAYHHHEKYNGKGYPFGLAGEAIPLSARIVAVADVYDALTSKRVYKEAMPHEQAAAIIREDAGSHFDPDVVAAFCAQEEHFRQLARDLADVLDELPCENATEVQAAYRAATAVRAPATLLAGA